MAVARAVEADADQAVERATVLGKQAGDVRLMVLHLHEGDPAGGREPAGPVRREVAGVQVGHDDRGRHIEQPQQVARRVAERLECLEVTHVADVLAHDRLIGMSKTDCRLEFATHGQHGRPRLHKSDRHRRIPA